MVTRNGNKPLIAKGWFHMSLWSFVMVGLIITAFITTKEIPAGAVTIYGLVLGCYAGSKTIAKLKTGKSSAEVKLSK